MNMIFCEVTEQSIDPMESFKDSSDPENGALNFFFGTIRKINVGREVVAVEYDAFIPLAEKTLREISSEAQQKWGEKLRISIRHRVGKLSVGEISVVVGVGSKHRDESYQASRYIIEQIKVRVPIWKKEYYTNGETEWLKGHALCQHSDHRA